MNLALEIIISISLTLISSFLTATNNITISLSIFVTIAVLIILICLVIIFEMNKYFKSIIGNQKRQIETDIKKSDNNLLYDDIGNWLFLLSLGQNLYEPLKITLLKKATYEHKNVLAALYLGNLYAAGLKKDDKVYIEKIMTKQQKRITTFETKISTM